MASRARRVAPSVGVDERAPPRRAAWEPPVVPPARALRPLERLWQFADPGKETAREVTRISHVLVAAEFDNERNPIDIRQQLGARHPYVRRALVETAFLYRQAPALGRAPGRCLFTQTRQALLLGLAYNLYRL